MDFCSKPIAGSSQSGRGGERKLFTKSLLEQSLFGEEDGNKEASLMSISWKSDHLAGNKKTMDFLTTNMMEVAEEKGEKDKKRFQSPEKLSKSWLLSPSANTSRGN